MNLSEGVNGELKAWGAAILVTATLIGGPALLFKYTMKEGNCQHYHKYEIVDTRYAISSGLFGQSRKVIVSYIKNGQVYYTSESLGRFTYTIGERSYYFAPCLHESCNTGIKAKYFQELYQLSPEMIEKMNSNVR